MTPRDILLNTLFILECRRVVPEEMSAEQVLDDIHMILQALWKQMDGHIKETPAEVTALFASLHTGLAIGQAMDNGKGLTRP